MQVQILGNLRNPQEIITEFLTEASTMEPFKSIKFDFRKYLTNKHNISKLLKR